MGLNTSMYQLPAEAQIESPTNALAKILELQNAQQTGQMNRMKMDEYQRGVAGESALSQLLASGKLPADIAAGLAGQGFGKQSMAYTKLQQDKEKAQADILHTGAQTGKLQSETLNMAVARQRDMLGRINDPQAAAEWVKAGYADPSMTEITKHGNLQQALAEIPQDPQGFARWKMQNSLKADDLIKMTTPDANAQLSAQTSTANNAATNATSRANNSASVGSAARTASNRLDFDKTQHADTMGKPFEATGPDGTPVLVRQDKQGNISRVEGFGPKAGGATKPLTEGQAKAVAFASRMENSISILDTLAAGGVNKSFPGSRSGMGVGAAVNLVQSQELQQLDQTKRDFINANLRRESGAVISDGEFRNAELQYFPQIGDGPKVIAQKATNRRIALEGMKADIPASLGDATGNVIKRAGSPASPEVKGGKKSTVSNW